MWPLCRSVVLTLPCAFLHVLADLWPAAQPATEPVAKDSLYLSPRSKPLKRASKFMASPKSSGHRTSHLATLSPPPPHPSICSLHPPLSLSLATGRAVWTQHLQWNILAASTPLSHLSLHLLSSLLPVFPAWGGSQYEWCSVIQTRFLSPPSPLFCHLLKENIA